MAKPKPKPKSTFDPNSNPSTYGTDTPGAGTTDYLGNAQNPKIRRPVPFGAGGFVKSYQVPGYKKGDQVALLPQDGGDLATLQQALYQAGYLTDAQYSRMVLGSPDEVTTLAFSKLLATANLSGVDWKDALSARLAATGSGAPKAKAPSVPPLTISLTNPDDIKKVAQQAAQTLNGTYLDDASLNSFIQSYQQQETQAQTQAYNQQYNPGAQAGESGYGPGGTTVNAPTLSGAEQELEAQIRNTKPNEVAANDFTQNFSTIVSSLTKQR